MIKTIVDIRKWLWLMVGLACGLTAFFIVAWPVHQSKANLVDYGGVDNPPDSISYMWVKPGSGFRFNDFPRYTPLNVTLRMSFSRPPEAIPAHVELFEQSDTTRHLLATYDYSPEGNQFQDYVVKVPSSTISQNYFSLEINGNSFRVPGDPRELGVRVAAVTLEVTPGSFIKSITITQLYLEAVIVLLTAVLLWCKLLKFSMLESGGLVVAIGITCGVIINVLAYWSIVLLLLSLVVLGCAIGWYYLDRSGSFSRPRLQWGSLFVALTAFALFFGFAPAMEGDLWVWRQIMKPLMDLGPIGNYPFSPKLIYPPAYVYSFWVFGTIASPFGLSYDETVIKIMFSLPHIGLLFLVWITGLKYKVSNLNTARAMVLFGFSISLVFVPVSWAQGEAWVSFLMIGSILLMYRDRPYSSAFMIAGNILYKAQGWLMLPVYGLNYLGRFGWKRAVLGGLVTFAILIVLGGLGFAYNLNQFIASPIFTGDTAVGGWVGGGTNSFNLLHLLGYNQQVIPTLWVIISYGLTGTLYAGIMLVMWLRQRTYSRLPDKEEERRLALVDCLFGVGLVFLVIFFLWVRMHERYLYYGLAVLPFLALWRRNLYKPLLLLNLLFILNLLYAYIPEKRDPIPNNFSLWRQAFHASWFQNILSVGGVLVCIWLVTIYFKPAAKSKPVPSLFGGTTNPATV